MKFQRKLLPNTIIEAAGDDSKDALTSLLETLNPTLTDLSRLFNGKISFADNIACLFRAVQFTYPPPVDGTLLNGVTEWGAGQRHSKVRKNGGWVDINGLLKHSPTGGVGAIYQVPPDYLPLNEEYYFPGTVDALGAVYTLTKTGELRIESFTAGGTAANKALSYTYRYEAADPSPPTAMGQFPLTVDVTPLNTRPSACIVTKTEIIDGKVIIPSPPLGIVWNTTTNGKTDTVKINDFVGAIPGRRYRVGLLFLP